MQFAYKSQISTIHCVNYVCNQNVNHYISNSSAVYVFTLDASKAFDRVNWLTLFEKLHKRSICPLFLRFLMHSYCNQKIRIKWNSALSGTSNTSNGVKQGGVLSPLLFTIYPDQLILSLKDLEVGCHLNGMFVGAFSYADDVTLLAPTSMALKSMLNTCTEFAASHNLLFNSSKTKCLYFNGPRSQAHGVVEFMGTANDFVDRAELLGVSICCDVKDRNINRIVHKFYCTVISVLYDFKDIPCDPKKSLTHRE